MTNKTFHNKNQLAKISYRIIAFIIDFYIYGIIGFIIGFFFGTPLENEIGYNLNGLPAIALSGIAIILWPMSEGIYGQTIGKRILKIKVVSNNLKPCGIGQAFVRYFFGFFDLIFLSGIIISIINKKNKRIGDLVANTIVIQIKKTTDYS